MAGKYLLVFYQHVCVCLKNKFHPNLIPYFYAIDLNNQKYLILT